MRVKFRDNKLDTLETDAKYTAGFSRDLVRAYRKPMQQIRSAEDEREFYALKSMRYEKLRGKRSHQRSMRLNDQFRLVIEYESEKDSKVLVVVSVDDYH